MNVKVVIFDLDDTLYDEINFVKSGFQRVANFFAQQYNLDAKVFYDEMLLVLEKEGRGKVFDNSLKKFNIFNKSNVKKAISVYRTHYPDIKLNPSSVKLLEYLRSLDIPVYVVTDGNKVVQVNKVNALKINQYCKKIFITHRYGRKHSKPSTYCFEKISELEGCCYRDVVYVGDNINKDFVNIKKLGFRTVRIINGMFKDAVKSKEYHAEAEIYDILDLKGMLEL